MSHTTDLPQIFPPEFNIGETIEFEKDFCDFPADEWTVTYYLRGPGTGFDAVGVADGTTHVFTIPATTTDDVTVAGVYSFQAWAVKGSEKHLVDSGKSRALASLLGLTANTTYNASTTAKQILDAIDALMLGKASRDQQEYTISAGGSQRQLARIPIPELLDLRKYYASIVRVQNSRGQEPQTIYVEFC